MMMMMMSERRRNWSPFTGTQREELQLQALIYQYLINGMSIPLQLLVNIKTSLNQLTSSSTVILHQPQPQPQHHHIGWSCYQMGHGPKLDPEPGRCRRTDGKKWRCSKEAGLNSKYCDRHKHRSKNRSRKHVESMEISDSTKPLFVSSIGRNPIQASLRIPNNQQKFLVDSSFSLCPNSDNSFRYGHGKINEEVGNKDHVFLSNAAYVKGKGYSSSLLDDSWKLKEKSYLGFTSKEQCQSQMSLGTEKDGKKPKKVMHHFI